MARKQPKSTKAYFKRWRKVGKVVALAQRAGTSGEQQAAEAALARMGATRSDLRAAQLVEWVDEIRPQPKDSVERKQPEALREHLTDAIVKKLQAPAKGNKVYYDATVPGFGCRVTAADTKSFVLNYYTQAGRERRITIGQFNDWSTTGARIKARQLRRLIDDGEDPLADIEAAREASTVADLCDRFETEHLPHKRPGTVIAYKQIIAKHIRPHFGKHAKVANVVFAEIDSLHRKISASGSSYAANRTIAVLSKMFNLAVRWDMRTDNPAKGIERNYEAERKRYLSGDELAALVKALAAHPNRQFANIIRVLLLTGARRGEVLSMRWADLDPTAGIWTKPGSTTKQKSDQITPLSAPARQLLSEIRDAQVGKHPKRPLGEFVFPGDRSAPGHQVEIWRSWIELCKSAEISGLRIHDLRHSFASQLASGGASLPLIGALLGHSNLATTARYSHLFIDPQRAAVEKVASIVDAAGKEAAAEPIKLKPRGRGRHGR